MLDSKIATKKDLIEAFSDGKMPDGKDFESFINSVVMQSGSETAFDEKTMSMLTANEYQTLKGMQNNKFVTPLLLSKAFKGLLDPQFDALKAKDSALEAKDAELARVDAALQAQLDAKFLQLQNTLTGNMNTLYARMLPVGSVIMWGLPLEQKPANFVVCDGTWHVINGVNQQVPNLQGRFALGVGNGYGFKAMGGEYNVTLNENQMPSHKHGGNTTSDGSHTHLLPFQEWTEHMGPTTRGRFPYARHRDATYDIYTPNTTDNGSHNHTIETDIKGGNAPHNNMPPYFTLYYLIKVSN